MKALTMSHEEAFAVRQQQEFQSLAALIRRARWQRACMRCTGSKWHPSPELSFANVDGVSVLQV